MHVDHLEHFVLVDNDIHCSWTAFTKYIGIAVEHKLWIYLKLLKLFHADDTVIIAKFADDLQNVLNECDIYCAQWKLSVNVNKTKIMIHPKIP